MGSSSVSQPVRRRRVNTVVSKQVFIKVVSFNIVISYSVCRSTFPKDPKLSERCSDKRKRAGFHCPLVAGCGISANGGRFRGAKLRGKSGIGNSRLPEMCMIEV